MLAEKEIEILNKAVDKIEKDFEHATVNDLTAICVELAVNVMHIPIYYDWKCAKDKVEPTEEGRFKMIADTVAGLMTYDGDTIECLSTALNKDIEDIDLCVANAYAKCLKNYMGCDKEEDE